MRDAFAPLVAVLLFMVSLACPPVSKAGLHTTHLITGTKRIAGPYFSTAGAIGDAFNLQKTAPEDAMPFERTDHRQFSMGVEERR